MSFPKEIQVILARQLAGCLDMPILIADTAGTLIFYNEPAEAILNQRFDETGELPVAEWVELFSHQPLAFVRGPIGQRDRSLADRFAVDAHQ